MPVKAPRLALVRLLGAVSTLGSPDNPHVKHATKCGGGGVRTLVPWHRSPRFRQSPQSTHLPRTLRALRAPYPTRTPHANGPSATERGWSERQNGRISYDTMRPTLFPVEDVKATVCFPKRVQLCASAFGSRFFHATFRRFPWRKRSACPRALIRL